VQRSGPEASLPLMDDPFGLSRFELAQDAGGAYDGAVSELRAGRKRSHWIWFVFPQIAGLGQSEMSRIYAISSLAEADAYLAHPVLGPRLLECARILTETEGRTAEEIFGPVDAMKLRSSVTLFARAAADDVVREVLGRYFDGVPDPQTERLLASGR
jgi:uncharacterized protein (DUF1810 family)